MKLATILILCTLVLMPAGGETGQQKDVAAVTEITLERAECYGTCPAYQIILQPDGTITYIGKAHVERIGTFRGIGQASDFRHTVELLRTIHFDQFKAAYGGYSTDIATEMVSVVSNGKRKTVVEDDHSVTTALWAIERVIDAQASQVTEWKKIP